MLELSAVREPQRRLLQASLREHSGMLDRIGALAQRYDELRQTDARTKARGEALQHLAEGVDRFEKLRSVVKDGATFYEDVKSQAERLRRGAADFKYSRDIERREQILQMGAGAGGGSGQGGP